MTINGFSTDPLELIGNTPLLKMRRMPNVGGADVFVKLEYFNLGGSIKDRAAKYIIEYAESAGILSPETEILEATSGNTGIAIAMLSAAKNYKCTIIMPESASAERRKIISAYGAKLILTPGRLGTAGAIELKRKLVLENPGRYLDLDQFSNPANVYAHYSGTAVEILKQLGGVPQAVVIPVGTGGTSMGISLRMKEVDSRVKIIGVAPAVGVKIDGIRNPKDENPSKLIRMDAFDEFIEIDEEMKQRMLKTLRNAARIEGIFLGPSSGCALHVALEEAKGMKPGKKVVAIAPDSGMKYLSTDSFPDLSTSSVNIS
ncbi:MAG: PLP-dependent cysteine synthase family protein [Thermoplasmatales archaeon]|nr:PLP-dependent cysteine synthase family protein [Thermoplasmatales archaeon]MCW6169829.1 PLP-dependent cysteine synthase family protein [Thermoplasmatales archaeon]